MGFETKWYRSIIRAMWAGSKVGGGVSLVGFADIDCHLALWCSKWDRIVQSTTALPECMWLGCQLVSPILRDYCADTQLLLCHVTLSVTDCSHGVGGINLSQLCRMLMCRFCCPNGDMLCRVGDMSRHVSGLVGNLAKCRVGKGVQNNMTCCRQESN